jgi:carboxypeptidase C (cathepsin A)
MAEPAARPVRFAFNDGPGSASIWLHLGALGPRRVVVPGDASVAAGPHAVVDNPHSCFEHFDLVFVDPLHTGWSVASGEDARKTLFSVDGDHAAALHAGARPGPARRARGTPHRGAERTAACAGAGEELRVSDQTFFFEALQPQGLIVGRLESRSTGPMAASGTRDGEFDPGIEEAAPAYTMAAMSYIAKALGLQSAARCETLSEDVHKHWNFNRGEARGCAAAREEDGFSNAPFPFGMAPRTRHPAGLSRSLEVAGGGWDLLSVDSAAVTRLSRTQPTPAALCVGSPER